MDPTEFSLTHKGYTPNYRPPHRGVFHPDPSVPDKWDWRDHGIVGPVKDQAQCGSCWAFSAISPLESKLTNATGQNVTLSEQEMVDCVKDILAPDNSTSCCYGCQGGEMYSVYQYLQEKQHGRDDTESEYPYKAVDQDCSIVPSTIKLQLAGYVSLPQNEVAIKQALYREGPISVGVDANTDWQLYTGGIYDPNNETCDPTMLDHGVVLVGYGTEKGLDYWIVRNSWGSDWGEHGYMRLARGSNACGVATSGIYPVLRPVVVIFPQTLVLKGNFCGEIMGVITDIRVSFNKESTFNITGKVFGRNVTCVSERYVYNPTNQGIDLPDITNPKDCLGRELIPYGLSDLGISYTEKAIGLLVDGDTFNLPMCPPAVSALGALDSCHDQCGDACSSGPCGSCGNLCCGCGCDTCKCCQIS